MVVSITVTAVSPDRIVCTNAFAVAVWLLEQKESEIGDTTQGCNLTPPLPLPITVAKASPHPVSHSGGEAFRFPPQTYERIV